MPTQITQIDNHASGLTTLRVEGDLFIEDARVLERIGAGIRAETGNRVMIDLADLDFLDSESAPYLRRIKETDGFEINGIELFVQTMIDQAERSNA